MLAVFERLGIGTLESLLGAAVGETSLRLVRFENQWANPTGGSVPDAAISARFTYLFEVKTSRGAMHGDAEANQLREHLKALDGSIEDERLIAVTPDPIEPPVIADIGDRRLSWTSFLALDQAIEDHLEGLGDIVGDRERYLLRELQGLFRVDGLVEAPTDVLIVAANIAYGEYKDLGFYVCQPGRRFREGISRIAFYADGEIKPEVPAIRHRRTTRQ